LKPFSLKTSTCSTWTRKKSQIKTRCSYLRRSSRYLQGCATASSNASR
jgi:hypothetical protein